jgi:hypothetical protein
VKLGSLSGGEHRWFKRSTGEKRPVTRDDDDDDDNNNNNFTISVLYFEGYIDN